MKIHLLYLCFHAVADFNNSVIETEIPEGQTQALQEIQIFDDDINEAQEEFEVFLTVEGNFTVTYTIQTTVCRIPENDRKPITTTTVCMCWWAWYVFTMLMSPYEIR